jgi:hypothetical protein
MNARSGWSSFLKAAIVVFVAIGLLLTIVAVAGWWWWSSHKQQVIESAKSDIEAGQKDGKTTDEQGCIHLALERGKHRGFVAYVSTGVYTRECLVKSAPSPTLCDDVPPAQNLIQGQKWISAKCFHAEDEQLCRTVYGIARTYCLSEEREKKIQNANH